MKPMTSDELKAAFAALPPMEPIEPAHNWTFWAWDLRQNVADKDLAEFLTWPGLVLTMFVGNAPYIDYEYDQLPLSIQNVIDDPQVGKPELYTRPDVKTSGNLIHQAYHFWQWKRAEETRLDAASLRNMETIIEIGGGYGAMALICHRLGFRGRYIIYDLPEFSLLQQYYLSNVGVDGVEFRTQIDKQIEADLLIGIHSLNEMPLDIRDTIIGLCPAQSYLIVYGANWGGWDNMGWALDMMKTRKGGYNWRNWNIPHLPNCWYLVGDKRE